MRRAGRRAVRVIVIFFCVILILLCVSDLAGEVQDYFDRKNYAAALTTYDRYLYDGDYQALGEWLARYNPSGEEYQLYWDVSDAYEAFTQYTFWQQAEGLEEDAALYEEQYKERLITVYEGSGDTARRLIASFAGELLP